MRKTSRSIASASSPRCRSTPVQVLFRVFSGEREHIPAANAQDSKPGDQILRVDGHRAPLRRPRSRSAYLQDRRQSSVNSRHPAATGQTLPINDHTRKTSSARRRRRQGSTFSLGFRPGPAGPTKVERLAFGQAVVASWKNNKKVRSSHLRSLSIACSRARSPCAPSPVPSASAAADPRSRPDANGWMPLVRPHGLHLAQPRHLQPAADSHCSTAA